MGAPLRRPGLRRPLHLFVVAALARLAEDVRSGEEVPFALDEARGAGQSAVLYDYRPLYGAYVRQRTRDLATLPDRRAATSALRDDPVLVAYAREQRQGATVDDALFDAVLLPVVSAVAEAAGGFEFDDGVLDAVLRRLEETAAVGRRAYAAFAPLTGVRAGEDEVDLGDGIVARRTDAPSLALLWPESQGLLPDGFGVEPGHDLVLAVDRILGREEQAPDHVRAFGLVVLALRLVLGGGVGAGPCAFERIEWAPRSARLMPAFASAAPAARVPRLDRSSASLARSLVDRIAAVERVGHAPPATALARYAVAVSEPAPVARVAALLSVLDPLLATDGGGEWAVAMRAAALAGGTAAERHRLADGLRRATALARPGAVVAEDIATDLAALADDVARAVLVVALSDPAAAAGLPELLDGVLLGSRPRPQPVQGLARSA